MQLIFQSEEKGIQHSPGSICWSPDGQRLAFAVKHDVFTVDLHTGISARCEFIFPELIRYLAWSPSNDHLVIGDGEEVYIYKVSMSRIRHIGRGCKAKWDRTGTVLYYWNAESACFSSTLNGDEQEAAQRIYGDWSINGRVVFLAENFRLKVAGLDGAAPRFIDETTGSASTNGMHAWADWARWSPDGRLIAYSQGSDIERIYIADPSLDEIKFLSEGKNPQWSFDGRRIVFVDRFETGIFLIDFQEPGKVQKIAAGSQPAWSPTGNEIAYLSGASILLQTIQG